MDTRSIYRKLFVDPKIAAPETLSDHHTAVNAVLGSSAQASSPGPGRARDFNAESSKDVNLPDKKKSKMEFMRSCSYYASDPIVIPGALVIQNPTIKT